MNRMSRFRCPRVAVVGAGVSGLTAAYLLKDSHEVTVYEQQPRLGGHAHTHSVVDSDGVRQAIDSGFIVHNDRTYPLLRRLYDELGVVVRPTEMSMSISTAEGVEYAGGRGVKGVFAQWRRMADRDFVTMLREVKRFHRAATSFLAHGDDAITYGDFLDRERFGPYFRRHYAIPLVSCVWSSGDSDSLRYPARYLFRFLANHGLLGVGGSLRWYTVAGGSRVYVQRLALQLRDLRRGQQVTSVRRENGVVTVTTATAGSEQYDKVVLATHADETLRILHDATVNEKQVLGAFDYTTNQVVLHTDTRLLPQARRARASWNYAAPTGGTRDQATGPAVTYWMNRLQRLSSRDEYLVSLNATDRIDPDKVIAMMDYRHPIYTPDSLAAQQLLPSLATDRTTFAGAYHGWGFHEDGCHSGAVAAARFGATRWAIP